MRRMRFAGPVMALFLGGSAAQAQQLPADIRFEFAWYLPNGTEAGNTLSVAPGSSFSLQVFLRQTAGSTNVLVSEGGLFGGVRATYGAPTGTAGVVSVAGVNDVVYNPRFNDTATSNASRKVTSDYAQFAAASDGTQAATPDAMSKVLVGTFTFQVSGLAGQSTTLRAERLPGLDSNVTFTNFFAPDDVLTADDLTVILTPTPEPGLALGLSAAVVAAAARSRRQVGEINQIGSG